MKPSKISKRPSAGAERTSGPNKGFTNPRKRRGNPTSGGKVFGNWHKPKTK